MRVFFCVCGGDGGGGGGVNSGSGASPLPRIAFGFDTRSSSGQWYYKELDLDEKASLFTCQGCKCFVVGMMATTAILKSYQESKSSEIVAQSNPISWTCDHYLSLLPSYFLLCETCVSQFHHGYAQISIETI